MIRKRLLILSFLLPFMVLPGVASASHNDQHRLKVSRITESAVSPTQDAQMFGAHKRDTSRPCRFLGGPKNNLVECR
jgi:hypothetical protein